MDGAQLDDTKLANQVYGWIDKQMNGTSAITLYGCIDVQIVNTDGWYTDAWMVERTDASIDAQVVRSMNG